MVGFRGGVVVLVLCGLLGQAIGASAQEQPQQEHQEQPAGESNRYTFPDLEVTETSSVGPVQEDLSEPASVSVLPKETIRKFAGPGQTNAYKVLNLLPSINAESTDPYGLVQDQSAIRIRGQAGATFGKLSQTINGLPMGITSGQGSMGKMVDLGNVDAISVTRGAIPADQGFGFGNVAGALDLHIQEPGFTPGATIEQKYGSYGFSRTFGRVDSGQLPTQTRLFGSASYSREDKWRGAGDIDRFNLMGGLVQPMAEGRMRFELYGLYNKYNQDEFRYLTYAQTKNLSNYREYDFTGTRTGIAAIDYANYRYNHQSMEEYAIFGKFELIPWQGAVFTFKPYYAGNDGARYASSANVSPMSLPNLGYVIQDLKQVQYGYITQLEQKIAPVDVKVGLWYQNIALYPPPSTSVRNYLLGSTGPYFSGWASLASVGDRRFVSPFVQTKTDLGRLHLQGGIKYLEVTQPSVTGYKTAGLPDASYDTIIDTNPAINPVLCVGESTQRVWLPNAGISYDLTDHLSARFLYGKNYADASAASIYQTYYKKYAVFKAAGVSLQHLWDDSKMETSDDFDLGLRYKDDTFTLSPTLFYARYQNKSVTVYDPTVRLRYGQNIASAESMGAELESSWKPAPWLTLFGAGSYNRFQFTDNLKTALNTTLRVKGNQVPDVPLWQAKLGFTATYKGFSATPLYRYVDSRYGDIQNGEQVQGYHLVDLYLAYDVPGLWKCKQVTFSLDFQNILDQRYIGIIRQSSDSGQSSSATYYPGAPFTVVAGVNIKF